MRCGDNSTRLPRRASSDSGPVSSVWNEYTSEHACAALYNSSCARAFAEKSLEEFGIRELRDALTSPTLPASAMAIRALPPENPAMVCRFVYDNFGSSLMTCVPSGSSSLMSYSMVITDNRFSEARQSSTSRW